MSHKHPESSDLKRKSFFWLSHIGLVSRFWWLGLWMGCLSFRLLVNSLSLKRTWCYCFSMGKAQENGTRFSKRIDNFCYSRSDRSCRWLSINRTFLFSKTWRSKYFWYWQNQIGFFTLSMRWWKRCKKSAEAKSCMNCFQTDSRLQRTRTLTLWK
jgi:hypothetical protein